MRLPVPPRFIRLITAMTACLATLSNVHLAWRSTTTPSFSSDSFLDAKQALDETQIVFDGVRARAWDGFSARPIPCPDPDATFPREGVLLIKPIKVGGSTAMSVNVRMARSVGRARAGSDDAHCHVYTDHIKAKRRGAKYHSKTKGFVWSIVRDPTKRTISAYFFTQVSRLRNPPSDSSFEKHAMEEMRITSAIPFLSFHDDTSILRTTRNMQIRLANGIMRDYNFIAVQERMDESIVVLQLLLGMPTRDMLYLNAKKSGSFDDGRYQKRCTRLVKSFVTPGMRDYLYNPHHPARFVNITAIDRALHRAVNASLDLTIDRIGKRKFQAALDDFLAAQKEVAEQCASPEYLPCSESNENRKPRRVCFENDVGCGLECIDRVADKLGLPEYEYRPSEEQILGDNPF